MSFGLICGAPAPAARRGPRLGPCERRGAGALRGWQHPGLIAGRPEVLMPRSGLSSSRVASHSHDGPRSDGVAWGGDDVLKGQSLSQGSGCASNPVLTPNPGLLHCSPSHPDRGPASRQGTPEEKQPVRWRDPPAPPLGPFPAGHPWSPGSQHLIHRWAPRAQGREGSLVESVCWGREAWGCCPPPPSFPSHALARVPLSSRLPLPPPRVPSHTRTHARYSHGF